MVAAIVLVLLGSVWALWQLRAPTTDSAAPSIAVLHFDNLTGDAELDWLRTGLTDMLVTDLSQSPNLTVLSIDRLFQILSDLDRLEDPVTSFETVREVAERANTDTVVLGSFMKAGDKHSYQRQDPGRTEWRDTDHGESRGRGSGKHLFDGGRSHPPHQGSFRYTLGGRRNRFRSRHRGDNDFLGRSLPLSHRSPTPSPAGYQPEAIALYEKAIEERSRICSGPSWIVRSPLRHGPPEGKA